jgi:hypothetical protein
MTSKSTETEPSIVFCHGLWADGSCFSKVIPALQAEGHQVIAAQYGLNTTADDVATESKLCWSAGSNKKSNSRIDGPRSSARSSRHSRPGGDARLSVWVDTSELPGKFRERLMRWSNAR